MFGQTLTTNYGGSNWTYQGLLGKASQRAILRWFYVDSVFSKLFLKTDNTINKMINGEISGGRMIRLHVNLCKYEFTFDDNHLYVLWPNRYRTKNRYQIRWIQKKGNIHSWYPHWYSLVLYKWKKTKKFRRLRLIWQSYFVN